MCVSVRVNTGLVNGMGAWYAIVKCFLVWRVKEGNAARERTNAPINHAQRIEANSPRMQHTKPLDPLYHCHGNNWSWFLVCQICVRHRYQVMYREKDRFDALKAFV